MKQIKRLFTSDTAASWLREHQRDLHLIMKAMRPVANDAFESEFISPMANNLLPSVLNDWLRSEFPATSVGIVRKLVIHSKHYWESWYIPFVDFSPQDLAHYKDMWEGVDQRGRVAGFWRKTLSYAQWRSELSNCKVCDQPRNTPSTVLWFETPIGLLWSPWECQDDGTQDVHRKLTIWMRAQELYPALVTLELKNVASGYLVPDTTTSGNWLCIADLPFQGSFSQQQKLKAQYVGESSMLTPSQRAICHFLGVAGANVTFLSDGWG